MVFDCWVAIIRVSIVGLFYIQPCFAVLEAALRHAMTHERARHLSLFPQALGVGLGRPYVTDYAYLALPTQPLIACCFSVLFHRLEKITNY